MIPDRWRTPLGYAAFFGGFAFLYSWCELIGIGMLGFGMAMLGFALCRICIGVSTGYWWGHDGTADVMLIELMRRIRERRATDDQLPH